ncbi:hypothetical protein CARUB_v10027876mg [Capsella rubella]|uniref:F-box domain-containing protein n=2 Tax=Capsella rubella TaxID=81985 RepID=R0GTX7_9BRAS|nr:hypothetical protein CARUB_v10027876mg [Capsella rubella]
MTSSKRMASSVELDALSNLPDVILILIISCLPFKECLRTSSLGKRWRYLYRETGNITFRETEYVDRSVSDESSKRVSFVNYMCQWISRYQSHCIETFELKFSDPGEFLAEMESLIDFAVSRQVKNLVLDFTGFNWSVYSYVMRFHKIFVHLPASVYNLKTLKSLKIYACGFDPSMLTNSGSLRKLAIGWIELSAAHALLLTSLTLKSLTFSHCWGVDMINLAGYFKEFEIENCVFSYHMPCSYDLPNVEVLKYSGRVLAFDVKRMNKGIEEVYLDFQKEPKYEEPNESTKYEGTILSGFLNSLRRARTLSVCPFLLQAIQECDDPSSLLRPMETQHLVLRTELHVMEFKGIKLLLDNCPNLETLTVDILGRRLGTYGRSYCGAGPRAYWKKNLTYKNFPKKLKVVVVKDFSGYSHELIVLKVLIQSGRGRWPGRAGGPVLERVELYMCSDVMEYGLMRARDGAEMLQSISGDVQVLVHYP